MRYAIALVSLVFLAAAGLGDSPDRPAVARERKDGNGDPLPDGAIQRYGSVRFRAGAEVAALQYSPDGATIAGLSADRITLWHSKTGVPRKVIRGNAFQWMT